MHRDIIPCGDGFWNIRGKFKLAGLVDIGTQASLIRMSDGRFIFLDSYAFSAPVKEDLDRITGGPDNVVAVINSHPFHTVYSAAMQVAYPNAKHYGTARHKRVQPDLAWEELLSEDHALWTQYPELQFSVPDGLEFIPEDETVHASSILVFHPATRTLHVDDTFSYLAPKGLLGLLIKPRLSVHPAVKKALLPQAGAAQAFRDWAEGFIASIEPIETLCTAHTATLHERESDKGPLATRMRKAIKRVEKVLSEHEAKWG